jgi:hypothetical protein
MTRLRRLLLVCLALAVCAPPLGAQIAPRQYREYVYFGGQLLVYDSNFGDVLPNSPYYPFVIKLANLGITGGCGASDFCPESPVTREQMAVFLLLAKEGPAYVPPACVTPTFSDVPCSSGFAKWIYELVRRGVTSGCGGGKYCPLDPVTREQMAVFLLRTKEGPGYTPPACTNPTFTDVPCSSVFAPWIYELVRRGITTGCGGGKYCPLDPVTRGQMAVFLTLTFGL